jgi:hypothetical protein
VEGKPIDKPYIDTDIVAATEELLILFDPKIIKIIQDFTKIKVSESNTQAGIETYGEIKNKVITVAGDTATSITSKDRQRSGVSLDATIASVNTILYFDPTNKSGDIWAICLGRVKVFSDVETLKKSELAEGEPMEKFSLNASNMSMAHFKNRDVFFQWKKKEIEIEAV